MEESKLTGLRQRCERRCCDARSKLTVGSRDRKWGDGKWEVMIGRNNWCRFTTARAGRQMKEVYGSCVELIIMRLIAHSCPQPIGQKEYMHRHMNLQVGLETVGWECIAF